MQQRSRILPALILTLCACAHSVLAETKYVTDQFEIMLRTGQSVQHEILRQLKSGTQVTVLESNYEYSRVRTASGKEGWVLTRYLIDQPAGRERAVKLQADLELLQIISGRVYRRIHCDVAGNAHRGTGCAIKIHGRQL